MGFRSLAVAAVLAMMAACLVPSVSASADFGGLLEEREEETVVVSEEGESSGEDNNVLGELLSGGSTLAATTYRGERIAISAKQAPASRTSLQGEDLKAIRSLIGNDSANGMRVTNAKGGADYVVLTDDAGLSVLIEIASAASVTKHSFDIDLPEGATLILTEEGTIDVLGGDRYTIAVFEAPWAVDADGNDLPTHFKVDGNTITQMVETDETTAYPVVADPHLTWGWISGTAYFDKWETTLLCGGSMHTLAAMAISALWLPILAAALAVMVVMACTARLLDKCIKVKSYGTVSMYSGGYCTWYH